jgi:hypothetical protein
MYSRSMFLLFINQHPSDLGKKANRFVLELDPLSHDAFVAGKPVFSGKVVARNRNAAYDLSQGGNSWGNPVADLKKGYFPCFVPVSKDWVKENMEFCGPSLG